MHLAIKGLKSTCNVYISYIWQCILSDASYKKI